MITSEMFSHLYSDSDPSPLNLSIGVMLTIIDDHNGEDTYTGEFEQDMSAAQANLDAAELETSVQEEIQHLIHEVQNIGPPTPPPTTTGSVRPRSTDTPPTPPPTTTSSVRPKYLRDAFSDLYVEGEDSPMNQSILALLTILDAHVGKASFQGDFDSQVHLAEQQLSQGGLDAAREQRIEELIELVKEVGAPH